MHLEDIIVEPIVSEKGWKGQDDRKYTFRVHPSANKIEICRAIERIFKVKVNRVWTMGVSGKPRRTRFYQQGKRPDWKKAIVQLAPGQRIEIYQ
ncbi:MAG: 50S ribosomal protein L23 [Candidatus Fraserbacteria bacterium RBG_16_55_9]|uniref:Large ribosomal subunit protein uL23 n=1 Tax=Fraserbacteria sp. (strain RBG_16_55_9) TaxID=1817864 RepID=A0A1F5UPB9_FRAXR|nr:MAG: 50S ribosomal protein L23 [Candidatus Fraserbacteria bacterium RBG_16_55_9]